ncbi:MAG: phosphopantetheine-binding protein [Rhodobacterales bacterium]|nr:MAG: phosphopantetheine-binding protein [Rhodobacterales bacterium]
MTEDEIRTRVIEIVARQAGVDPRGVTPATTLDALGIDSLRLVEAIFAIEEAFGISVPYNASDPAGAGTGAGTGAGDGAGLSSIGAIADVVSGLVRAGKG